MGCNASKFFRATGQSQARLVFFTTHTWTAQKWMHLNKENLQLVYGRAVSFPGHSQLLSRSHGENHSQVKGYIASPTSPPFFSKPLTVKFHKQWFSMRARIQRLVEGTLATVANYSCMHNWIMQGCISCMSDLYCSITPTNLRMSVLQCKHQPYSSS